MNKKWQKCNSSFISVVIDPLANRKSITRNTIGEFCYKNIYEEIPNQSKVCEKVDIVTGSYPNGNNLKEMTQHRRGMHWGVCGIW